MIRHWFANPWGLMLLALVPALGVVAVLALRRRRRTLAQLGPTPALEALALVRGRLRALRVACLGTGLVLLVAGIAGPQWGRDWEQSAAPGRDLVVVVDVSRSMLAQDVLPNRLERVKKALEELSHTVQQRGGHRLALVAFASRARVVCPLTHDYDHFRTALAELDAAHPHPDVRPDVPDVPSGTRIGAGLGAALALHDPRFRGHQDILLLSDGDDPARDREWRESTAEARAQGIAVHTVGVGDPEAGSPVPLKGDVYLHHNGQLVQTRLEKQPLEEIARATGATYTPAHTQALPLGELFRTCMEPQAARADSDDALPVYRQRSPWFLGLALAFLGMEMVIGPRRLRKAADSRPKAVDDPSTFGLLPAALCFSLALLGAGPGSDPEECVRQGNAAFARGEFATAVRWYEQAEVYTTDPGQVAFNKAAALYRLGDYREAERHYRRSREGAEGPRLARVLYDLGNCLVQRAEDRNLALLEEAIRLYEQCLGQAGADAALAGDARHNLELAKLLWLKAKAAQDDPDRRHPNQGSEDAPPDGPRDQFAHDGNGGLATPDPRGKVEPLPDQPGDAAAARTRQTPPGKGNLPPLPDEDELVALAPEDAAEHLRRAAVRIAREQQEYRQRGAAVPLRNVMDW
jgi:Ca-activated chloride channel family protein